jgi:hypothetical protein
MAARAHSRGWPIVFVDGAWRYEDDLSPADQERVCKRCGLDPTVEGYDACLGYIKNCKSACCGHGVTEPIRI